MHYTTPQQSCMRKGIVTLGLLVFLRTARIVNTFRLFAAPTQRLRPYSDSKATPFDLLSAHYPIRAFTRNFVPRSKQPGGDDEEFVAPTEFHIQEEGQEEDMVRAMTKRNATQAGSGKKGGSTRSTSSKKGNSTSAAGGTKTKKETTKTPTKPPATPSNTTKKASATASSKQEGGGRPSRYGEGTTKQSTLSSHRGKSAEKLVEDVEVMAKKAGVELPKDEKKKKREVKSAIEETSDRPYREYSKQGALEKLKKTHKVAKKPEGKGDPFADADRRSARSKRGINAPPSEEEKKLPPTKRHTKAGGMSERSKVSNEKNRALADALYELADFVLHGDTLQKGLSYQKAGKSVREAKQPIQSKEAAQKLAGVGRSVGDKMEEFVKTGKIKVLEEYRSGQRGK